MSVVKRLAAVKHLRSLKRAKSLDKSTLASAQSGLVACGESIIPSVIELLPDPEARAPAIEVLKSLLTDRTLPTFITTMSGGNSASVSSGLVEILSTGTQYDPMLLLEYLALPGRSGPLLESVLQKRADAFSPLDLVARLTSGSKESRSAVFRLLENREPELVVDRLIPLLAQEDWWIRLHALRLLARAPSERAASALLGLLHDSNKTIRLEVVASLGKMRAMSAIPGLCAALRDKDLKVHTAAIEALISIRDPAAVPHLVDVLKDESEYARRGAVEVLNEVATTDAIRDLVFALRDEDWWVRVRAADALGTLGGERVVEAILELMESDDLFIRRYAVEILNSVPDQRAVRPLIKSLEDEDWWVRERSIDALAKTKDPEAIEPLIRLLAQDADAQPLCARALGSFTDDRVIEPLCDLIDSESEEVRREAIESLVGISKLEISPESKARILAALQEAGISRTNQPPSARRRQAHQNPEFGRQESKKPMRKPRLDTDSQAISDDVLHSADTLRGKRPPGLRAAAAAGEIKVPEPAEQSSDFIRDFRTLKSGTILANRYHVLRQIGSGGFGSVYLAEDTTVKENVILKILNPQVSMDETMISRFVRELRLTRRITHKYVIRLYDFLDIGGAHAISMEYFPGKDLALILKESGALSVTSGLRIAEQICEGLQAAHQEGIIHRDVKPPNVLIGPDGGLKIVDFGLASMAQNVGSRLTKSGILIGTPHYMAPEQITGDEVDARTDIYSLGVVMYEMFSGLLPFQSESAVTILFKHLQGEIKPLREIRSDIPEALERLVMSAMARKREERPASTGELLEMMRALELAA